ncbi:DUF5597 domain-containing protein [Eisenbergiella sp.]
MSSQRTIYTSNSKPWIAIAGEVHNSTSSSAAYMEKVWNYAQELGMNTLLLPVSWELIEPVEGRFDFQLVDKLIFQARNHQMKIIFLWFGTWKNAQCMYVPEWIKKDLERFPRAQVEKGKNKIVLGDFYGMSYTTLSYLGSETNKADAKAFAELMKHIRRVDEKEGTVIGVQVENETGLQGAAREHSDLADAAFEDNVPPGLVDFLKTNIATMESPLKEAIDHGANAGTWNEVFGKMAEEAFSAYYIARYVEQVAAAGKAVYNLPLTVNCWLDKGEEAGKYPSGGPVAKVMEIWKFAAPSIDAFAPDIYVPSFHEVCEQYMKLDNPLVIPETAIHSYAAPRLVYSIGHYHCACFSPFGFEDMGKPFNAMQGVLFGMDVSDPLLKQPQDTSEYGWCGKALHSMMDLLVSKYGTSDLQAVISEKIGMASVDLTKVTDSSTEDNIGGEMMIFGNIGFRAIMNLPLIQRKDGVCMIIKESEETFYILVNGCMLAMFSADPQNPNLDILSLEEGAFVNGKWTAERRLNGDEVASLMFNNYTLLKLKVFTYV